MDAVVRFRGNVYYQVDQKAAIGGKCDVPESYTTKHSLKTLNILE
jgi:hypothetical protein